MRMRKSHHNHHPSKNKKSSKRALPVMIGSKDGGSNTSITSSPSNNSPSKHLGRSSSVPTERPAPATTAGAAALAKSQKPAENSFNASPLHLVKSASTSTLTSSTNTSTSSNNANTHRTRASTNAKEAGAAAATTDSNIKDELYEKGRLFHSPTV
ncbi:rho GTPase-activating protein gacF-like [Macrobrachium nipponense]|uniref:rho GTPase-activating protein gacF-like n=1 Tax=Macrobrachium nipponense TaxID=159736 RepID=UPI0030C80E87